MIRSLFAPRTHRPAPAGRASVRRTVRRLLGHRPMPARVVDEPTFMMLLDLELERARRNQRAFGLTRFDVDHVATRDTELAEQIVEQIRACDVATIVDDHLVVLWSESLPTEVTPAIDRVVRAAGGALVAANSVAFPSNALTRASLLGRLFGPALDVGPLMYPTDGPSTDADDPNDIAV